MNDGHLPRCPRLARIIHSAFGLAALIILAACTTVEPEKKTAIAWQQLCSACHGPDGTSVSARAPVLAGQKQAYLVQQLKAFRDHSRANAGGRAFMWPMAAGLDDAMIDHLASHFSSLPPPPPEIGSSADVAQGKALYESGPCSSCHGGKGQGMAPFPRLAGQHADYTTSQLVAYANDSRPNPVMGPMSKTLSSKDIQSIAAYLATQR